MGLVLLVGEALSGQGGGWAIGRFTLSKVYWLALAGYALASTLIVLAVGLWQRGRGRPFTRKAVILSHGVPVALVWVLVSLGFHDRLQDALRSRGNGPGGEASRTPGGQGGRERGPVSGAPSTMERRYGSGGEPVGAEAQQIE